MVHTLVASYEFKSSLAVFPEGRKKDIFCQFIPRLLSHGLGRQYEAAVISAAAKMKVRQNNPKKCLTMTIKSQRIYQSLLSSDF